MLCSTNNEYSPEAAPYTVRPDDTFYKISKYYNITLDDLIEANPETDPDHIKVGDTLCIPLAQQNVHCPAGTETYTIQEDDTIYKLSLRLNVSMNMLLKMNSKMNPDTLLPGQIICIPKPWSKYVNDVYKVSFLYPPRWARINALHYEGVDGFFRISSLNSDQDLEEICKAEAYHKLKPYGSRPEIVLTAIAGFKAGLVLPSMDQPMEMKKQAAVILQYPYAFKISHQLNSHLVLWIDKDHISDIRNSLIITV